MMVMVELISEDSDVFLYLDRKRTYLVKVQADKSFHTHKGYVQLSELIGKEYGTPVCSSMGIWFVKKSEEVDSVRAVLTRDAISVSICIRGALCSAKVSKDSWSICTDSGFLLIISEMLDS